MNEDEKPAATANVSNAELLSMDLAARTAAVRADLSAKGFTDRQIDAGISLPSLPKSGKFTRYEIREMLDANGVCQKNNRGEDIKWIELFTEPLGHISLNALVGQHADTNDRANVVESSNTPGTFVLSTVAMNPALSGHADETVAMLLGKSFTAEEKDGFVMKFSRDGYKTAEDVKIVPKRFYKVTL